MTDPELLRHMRWVLWASWGCLLCNIGCVVERLSRRDWFGGGASFFVVLVFAIVIHLLTLTKRKYESKP